MSPRGCSFTDKLPLELRREIYKFVLQHERPVKLVTRLDQSERRRINISLFTVNKTISRESRDILFETNTITASPHQILDLINHHGSHLRSLQIEDSDTDSSLLVRRYMDAAGVLAAYSNRTPKLKRVNFECKGLHITARHLVNLLALRRTWRGKVDSGLDKFRCIAVGRYSLPIPKLSQEWQFSYNLLVDLWDYASRQKDGFAISQMDIPDFFSSRGALRIPKWASQTGDARTEAMKQHNIRGLAARVHSYSSVEDFMPSLHSEAEQLEYLRRFELVSEWEIKEPAMHASVEYAGRIKLRDVRSDHGSEVLEWATELLGPNTKDFAREFGKSREDACEYVRGNQ